MRILQGKRVLGMDWWGIMHGHIVDGLDKSALLRNGISRDEDLM